ncbi:Far-red elongated hypocotyl 1, putative isoform 2 [Hibiscus syriacus]|uniref:Far-red elongated hypocotyl 1, putative isoform 2 n=2 Tax=Hibiscus syriacus TaxID=106335 RepID=A0A6A3AD38_HIBSY|nr:Far-red elongated hypocotyl 1, putative isoform 2 [Hibiscus syriacus]
MEIDNKKPNPSQIKSFLDNSLIDVDLNKKRKLKAEQLGLPLPKHQCWKQSLSLKPPPTLGSVTKIEGFSPCIFKGKGGDDYDVSEIESAKDSNSLSEDSDTSMSMHADAKYSLFNSVSSWSPDWGSSSRGSHSDGTTVASSSVGKDVLSSPGDELETADARLAENLQETLAEYGDDIDYIYSGYGNYTIEQYQDKEIEETIKSDGANPNVYVLSSGRWSVNQEAPETKRKPTIDQEFEQYFSTLML